MGYTRSELTYRTIIGHLRGGEGLGSQIDRLVSLFQNLFELVAELALQVFGIVVGGVEVPERSQFFLKAHKDWRSSFRVLPVLISAFLKNV